MPKKYVKKYDLDNLLKKQPDKLPWLEDQEETYKDAIDHVGKRFKTETKPTFSKGTPSKQILPFYSHENDVFKAYEDGDNPLIDAVDENGLAIGVLSRLQEKTMQRVNGRSTSKTNQFSNMILTESELVLKELYKFILDSFVENTKPEHIVSMSLEKRDGNKDKTLCFSISMFSDTFVESISKEKTRLLYHKTYVNPYTSTIIATVLSWFNDFLRNMNKNITADITKPLNSILQSPTLPDKMENIRQLFIFSSRMGKSELENRFVKAQDGLFDFSRNIMRKYSQTCFSKVIYETLTDYDTSELTDTDNARTNFNKFLVEFTDLLCDTINGFSNKKEDNGLLRKKYFEEDNTDIFPEENDENIFEVKTCQYAPPRRIKTDMPKWE